MAVDPRDPKAVRALQVRGAVADATLAARNGLGPDANPYRWPHYDRGLAMVWLYAYRDAGGFLRRRTRRVATKARQVALALWDGDGS